MDTEGNRGANTEAETGTAATPQGPRPPGRPKGSKNRWKHQERTFAQPKAKKLLGKRIEAALKVFDKFASGGEVAEHELVFAARTSEEMNDRAWGKPIRRVEQEVSGPDGGPVETEHRDITDGVSALEAARHIAFNFSRADQEIAATSAAPLAPSPFEQPHPSARPVSANGGTTGGHVHGQDMPAGYSVRERVDDRRLTLVGPDGRTVTIVSNHADAVEHARRHAEGHPTSNARKPQHDRR